MARFTSCPRGCDTDIAEHNSSGFFGGGCDTDASLAEWFRQRGVQEADIPYLVDEYRGTSEGIMDQMYSELHGA